MQPREGTQEIIDLVEKHGIRNPIELELRTGKSVKAIRSVAYRYGLELESLPTGKGKTKKMRKEIQKKLRAERMGEAPAPADPKSVEDIEDDVVKDSKYYLVLALAYKRVDEHIDRLGKEFPDNAGLNRLKTDLKQASAVAEAKVALTTSNVGDLVE